MTLNRWIHLIYLLPILITNVEKGKVLNKAVVI